VTNAANPGPKPREAAFRVVSAVFGTLLAAGGAAMVAFGLYLLAAPDDPDPGTFLFAVGALASTAQLGLFLLFGGFASLMCAQYGRAVARRQSGGLLFSGDTYGSVQLYTGLVGGCGAMIVAVAVLGHTVGRSTLNDLHLGVSVGNLQFNSMLRSNLDSAFCRAATTPPAASEGALGWIDTNCFAAPLAGADSRAAFAAAQCDGKTPRANGQGIWAQCGPKMSSGVLEYATIAEVCLLLWAFVHLVLCYSNFRLWDIADAATAEAGDDTGGSRSSGRGKKQVTGGARVQRVLVGLWANLKEYFSSGWNYIDIASHTLMMASIGLKFTGSRHCNVVSAAGVVVAWTNVLSYLRGYKSTGPLLRMINEIIIDSIPFLIVLTILICAFAAGFFMLFAASDVDAFLYDSGETESPYYGPQAILTVFKMLLGDFDTATFEYSSKPWLTMSLFVIFMVIICLIISMNSPG
jgi:hypothetical protein